jgi:hypothetical protein
MAVLPYNDPIRSSNQVPKVRIDNGNCESYLLATLEPSGLLYFPLGAATRSAIAAPLSSTVTSDPYIALYDFHSRCGKLPISSVT